MDVAHFMRIEREAGGKSKHYVVYTHDPKLTLELTPDRDATDGMGKGVIKRICVPNSWAGNYTQYAKLVSAAQEFFQQSMGGEPVAKSESQRFAR